jgi:hypothetical protein
VALMGMWVRSYYRLDGLTGLIAPNQSLAVNSAQGRLEFVQQPVGKIQESPWSMFSLKYPHPVGPVGWQRPFGLRLFPASNINLMWGASYWFLVLISGSLAMIFRLRWPVRFTIRDLIIVTTFLAVVLGMMAWLDMAWIGK